ncbi:hypothetical protein [Microbacterium sp. B35-04]|uniref:hypothetical protein n=1 Tax=Microbacterium sp. B35-04 TaxID=1961716 RepID=UPI001EF7580B|nr:hypothetical protein [Microbacterium sp. B35-04]
MTQLPSPDPPRATDPTPAVEVDVARTGGIAGITRRWSAQPPESEASEWISLIDRCPWSEAPSPVGAEADGAAAKDQAAPATDPPRSAADAPASSEGTPSAPRAPMPDGFVWFIRATWSGADPHEAELPDDAVVGAWRELVDAVRDWNRQGGSSGSGRAGR